MEIVIWILSVALAIAIIIILVQKFEIKEVGKQIFYWRDECIKRQNEAMELWKENARLKTELKK